MPKATFSMAYCHRPHSQICSLAFDRNFETISEFRIPFTFECGYPNLVGSCNGILCFSDFVTSKSNDVYLWNPSIRKFKRLPNTCLTRLSNVELGFVYDSQNNDYKVVRFSWNRITWIPPPEIEVYSLSSDSWKRIELGISWRSNVLFHKFNYTLTFPFVSGHLHWMIEMIEEGGGQERLFTYMILSFDVNSEKFKELQLPDDEGDCISKCLTSFKEKLALIKFESCVPPHSMLLCSIWLMREYSVFDSWNKLCVVPVESFPNFIGLTKYGLLLVRKWSQLVSTNSESESKDKTFLIDPETLHEKEISYIGNHVDNCFEIAAYMESLTLLNGENLVSY
uniref:F-box associated beta-propeller type 3 domain-containing protein n=1 Tax=Quercus lobata TaxID=97700 RepID=A0A7N2MIM2_QUELO